jgi:hypothetical protein
VAPAYVLLDGKHAFVTAQGSGDLWIFDQASFALVRRISFGSDSFPQRMGMTPDGRWILVCVDGAEQIAAVDTEALEVLDQIATNGVHPQAIAVLPGGRQAVLTDENDLVHPGRIVRLDLAGLGSGGAHIDEFVGAHVFPQPIIVVQ